MKKILEICKRILEIPKLLSICGILFLIFFTACENLPLGMPGNALSQAEMALDSQKKAMKQMSEYNKKELIENKEKIKSLIDKAEPFLARRSNELVETDLILTQDQLKKSQYALRNYLDARTQPGKDTTTSEMNRALSQASESISRAEDILGKFKNKQSEQD